jgi:hypothetical protein
MSRLGRNDYEMERGRCNMSAPSAMENLKQV